MSTTALAARDVNASRKDSYAVYWSNLIAQLEGDFGKLYLFLAIMHFRADHQSLRNFWERYWNEDRRTAPEDQTEFDVDYNYWERVWHMRRKAIRVMRGLEPWPPEFLPWKTARETRYYIGGGRRPAWLDFEDDAPGRTIKTQLADVRHARRAKFDAHPIRKKIKAARLKYRKAAQ